MQWSQVTIRGTITAAATSGTVVTGKDAHVMK